eukprot:2445971-Rhodomonas_salina.1
MRGDVTVLQLPSPPPSSAGLSQCSAGSKRRQSKSALRLKPSRGGWNARLLRRREGSGEQQRQDRRQVRWLKIRGC